ncbi:hypothetical protein HYH03_009245 [Edaphochlamys debaryana]|uniref:F-box domain-containing protein n=1 Tax=Edaphochlamys debaryana TaxID=47281 RepID=A0A835XZH5_9CHLO|nr:hypothetical protein HYH03_009245 [Edaphochlamys debaryana]|eukprot:KAG2492584.1 hypothetical protein HYH03_009245 [Edaphochlamys debaryana]
MSDPSGAASCKRQLARTALEGGMTVLGLLWLPSELVGKIFGHLDDISLVAAVLACRSLAEAAAKQGVLKTKREAKATHSWGAVLDKVPSLSLTLGLESPAKEWTALMGIVGLRWPLNCHLLSVLQLTYALELLWTQVEPLMEGSRVERQGGYHFKNAIASFDQWERQRDQVAQIAQRAYTGVPPSSMYWWAERQQVAMHMLQSPSLLVQSISAALPLRPEALEHLRYRLGLAPAGGNWGPGPRLPYLNPAEVAEHSPVAGRLAMWLLGMERLMRTGYELEAVRAWAWAGPSAPTRPQAMTAAVGCAGGGSGSHAPASPGASHASASPGSAAHASLGAAAAVPAAAGKGIFQSGGGGSMSTAPPTTRQPTAADDVVGKFWGFRFRSATRWNPFGPADSTGSGGGGGGGSGVAGSKPIACSHLQEALRAAQRLVKVEVVEQDLQAMTESIWRACAGQDGDWRPPAWEDGVPLLGPMTDMPHIGALLGALEAWQQALVAANAQLTDLAFVLGVKRMAWTNARTLMSLEKEREAALLVLKGCR